MVRTFTISVHIRKHIQRFHSRAKRETFASTRNSGRCKDYAKVDFRAEMQGLADGLHDESLHRPCCQDENTKTHSSSMYSSPSAALSVQESLDRVEHQGIIGQLLENETERRDTGTRYNEVGFLAQCTQERRMLFKAHRQEVMCSVRRWEKLQMRIKALDRATRLARVSSQNEQLLVELKKGVKVYNLKSIRQAAVQGDLVRLSELLEQGFNPDAQSAMGLTPLVGACQSGALDAVRILLRHGANVNHQHIKTKRTALMEASARESLEIVRELLRCGAKIHLRDAHGETAFDCAANSCVRDVLELANTTWSSQCAELYPVSFRAATVALLLVQKRQQNQHRKELVAARRELTPLRLSFVRSAADAKVHYDQQVRASHEQVSLLRKVRSLVEAETQFDHKILELFKLVEQALLSLASLNLQRALPNNSISTILAFCDRHWFDRKPTKQTPIKIRSCNNDVKPTKKAARLQMIFPSLQAQCNEVDVALQYACDQLQRAQEFERPDIKNGVTRNSEGYSLATLQVKVLEVQQLAYRDPRVLEPIDPIVRISLQSQASTLEVSETHVRVRDRHPIGEEEFKFTVESANCDLVIQLIDAKRQEISGGIRVELRSLLDQKQHEEWFVLPPTLRQQVLEKSRREHSARVHLTLRFTHTPSIVLAHEINQLLEKRAEVLSRKRDHIQRIFDECIQKLVVAQL